MLGYAVNSFKSRLAFCTAWSFYLSGAAFYIARNLRKWLRRTPENVQVQGTERRIKPIMKQNLVFLKEGKILPHDHLFLETADSVTVSFEYRKRDDRDDQVTQFATKHPLFCPVKIAARRVPATRPPSTQLSVWMRWGDFNSRAALTLLRDFISDEGGPFDLYSDDIDLQSLRASAAISMYLNDIPVVTIMLLGRWSSNAFLRYIHPQVQQFSRGVASKMMKRVMSLLPLVPPVDSTSLCLPRRLRQ
jgi:hypothetical protein